MRWLVSRFAIAFGLPVLAALGGCGSNQSAALPPPPMQWDESYAVHMHPTEGPHHGMLIEIGKGDYHAELIHDASRHLVGIYLLDATASSPVLVAEPQLAINLVLDGKPTQFHLPAHPLDGELVPHTSHFELVDAKLWAALDRPDTRARFNVLIQGKPFVVTLPKRDQRLAGLMAGLNGAR